MKQKIIFFYLCVCWSLNLHSQDFANLYDFSTTPGPNEENVFKSGHVLFEYFHATPSNSDGFIMVNSTADNSATSLNIPPYTQHGVFVSLLDLNGNPVPGMTKKVDNLISNQVALYPVAMAYNSVMQQYFIACNALLTDNGGTHANLLAYYILLDQDLNVLNHGYLNLNTQAVAPSGQTVGGWRGHYIGDVCPVYEDPDGTDFAIVGKTPDPIIGNPDKYTGDPYDPLIGDSRLFIAKFDANTSQITYAQSYDFKRGGNNAYIAKEMFPSCIIEVSNPTNPNSGYFVCGSSKLNGFYLWSDYGLSSESTLEVNAGSIILLSPSRANYDVNEDAIYIAGSYNYSQMSQNGYYFDKVNNITTTPYTGPLNTSSQSWPGTLSSEVGVILDDISTFVGLNHVGRIYEPNWLSSTTTHRVIGGKLVENSTPSTNSTYIPTLFEMDFSDSYFSTWGTNSYLANYYDKNVTSSLFPQVYDITYDYNKLYYPDHQFPEYGFTGMTDFAFGTVGLSNLLFPSSNPVEDVRIGLVRTFNGFGNTCNHLQYNRIPKKQSVKVEELQIDKYENIIDNPYSSNIATGYMDITPYGCTSTAWKGNAIHSDLLAEGNEEIHISIQNDDKVMIQTAPGIYDSKIELLNVQGQLIESSMANQDPGGFMAIKLDIHNLSKGMYFIKMYNTEKRRFETFKISL